MYGMELMKDSVAPLADIPEFQHLLVAFSVSIVGVLFGAVFTGIIQSSAASVGMLLSSQFFLWIARYKQNIYRIENLTYDEIGDCFACPNGKKLIHAYDSLLYLVIYVRIDKAIDEW